MAVTDRSWHPSVTWLIVLQVDSVPFTHRDQDAVRDRRGAIVTQQYIERQATLEWVLPECSELPVLNKEI